MLDGDEQQQWLVARDRIRPDGGEDEDCVEVDAAEIGAKPPAAVQPVGVGDVRVERRPDDVDARAHRAGARPAVATGGRVADLVERGGQRQQPEDQHDEHGLVDDLAHAAGDAVGEEEPGVHGEQPADDGGDDRGQEERAEDVGDRADRVRRDDRDLELERQHRVGGLLLRRLRARACQDSERRQLLRELEDAVAVEAAPEPLGDAFGDRIGVAAVHLLEDEVEELGQLDDLPVRAADEVRLLLEPRALVLADQLDAVCQAQPCLGLRRAAILAALGSSCDPVWASCSG